MLSNKTNNTINPLINKTLKFCLILIVSLFFFNCEELTGDSDETELTIIKFSPSEQSISTNTTATLDLMVENLSEPCFALTLQLSYHSSFLSFNDSTGYRSGDFFGEESISFVKEEDSVVYIAISLIRGEEGIKGSGSLGKLVFLGEKAGSGTIQLQNSKIHFFDSGGDEILIGDFETETATIEVN
jgi:hypothetical protein|tara:strand:- start:112 stop:669 length:558 start_codon:yes stop_codon:yes gene_type:complete